MTGAPAIDLMDLFSESEAGLDLAQAALALARIEYPDLEIAPALGELDRIAASAERRMAGGRDPDAVVSAINGVLFEELGFQGNHSDYYDPRNSCLNDVLERRTGIPITLSIVYLEIARRLDLPIYGIGLPAHFMVKYDDRSRVFFIDPFHEGRLLNRQGCGDLVRTLHGRAVELNDLHFAAVDARSIVLRMCNNLRGIYLTNRQYRKAFEVIDAILALEPNSPDELKQRAWLNHELGRRKQALDDLEIYSALRSDGGDAKEIERWKTSIRRTLAQFN